MRPADSPTVLPFADPSLVSHVWAAVIVSNLAHLLSVLLLHRLAALMLPGLARSHTAFLTAIVHLFSPAGLFLAAPYGEAPFSLLNFSGMLCYAHACADGAPLMLTRSDGRRKPAHAFLYLLVSGFCFGLATMVRSNGIFSGLIFLYDVLRSLRGLLGSRSEQISSLIRIASSVMAGIVTGSGFVIPQWLAYRQYCVRVSRLQGLLGDSQLTQIRRLTDPGAREFLRVSTVGSNSTTGRLFNLCQLPF